MRRATAAHFTVVGADVISIHALHEESDPDYRLGEPSTEISIHALHEESDFAIFCHASRSPKFQSTLSMRRATRFHDSFVAIDGISIHALHEESDLSQHFAKTRQLGISIHALHEESDLSLMRLTTCRPRLISIHALHEESDNLISQKRGDVGISIHALHEESDRPAPCHRHRRYHFNPRSP